MMEINLLVGITGMVFILVAFVLEEFYRRFNQDTVQYNLLNILGSGLLLYYAFTLSSWPFMILNGVWLIAALIKLGKIGFK